MGRNWIPSVGVTTTVEFKKKEDEYDLNITKIFSSVWAGDKTWIK